MLNKFILLGGLALCTSSLYAEDYFTISDFVANPGSEVEVKVYLTLNTALTAGLEDGATSIDIILPEGISVATEYDDWDEVYVPKLEMAPSDKSTGFTYGMSVPNIIEEENSTTIRLSSIGTKTKTGTFLYCTINLAIADNAKSGKIGTTGIVIGENYISDGSVNFNILNTITLDSKGYASYSVCAPVNVTGAVVKGATLDTDGSALILAGDGTTVPANTGVILVGDPGAEVSFTAAEAADDIESDLIAAVVATDVEKNSTVVLKKDAGTFATFTGTVIPAQKAYLNMSDLQKGPIRIVDGTVNGIEAIMSDNQITSYNLMGQRIQTQRGIVLENGKKAIKM